MQTTFILLFSPSLCFSVSLSLFSVLHSLFLSLSLFTYLLTCYRLWRAGLSYRRSGTAPFRSMNQSWQPLPVSFSFKNLLNLSNKLFVLMMLFSFVSTASLFFSLTLFVSPSVWYWYSPGLRYLVFYKIQFPSLTVYVSDVDPVGSAFILVRGIRIQRYKMTGKAEFNQLSAEFFS